MGSIEPKKNFSTKLVHLTPPPLMPFTNEGGVQDVDFFLGPWVIEYSEESSITEKQSKLSSYGRIVTTFRIADFILTSVNITVAWRGGKFYLASPLILIGAEIRQVIEESAIFYTEILFLSISLS